MDFSEVLTSWPEERVREMIFQATHDDVMQALTHDTPTPQDLAALLSPCAASCLEDMAKKAHRVTRHHFGRTITLFSPIYLSNRCSCDCAYCGYALRSGESGERTTLTEPEIRAECRALSAYGFQNVLLLTGDTPRLTPVSYLAEAVAIAREYFTSVSVEVYALDSEGYQELVKHGLDGVTMFMETYHRETYTKVHLAGRKKNYLYRLNAIERAGKAGARRLGIGALLGLYDWHVDGFWTALHAKYLQKNCWQSAVSVSFPRLLHTPPRFPISEPLSDAEFVQLLLATRLFLPEVGFTLSTRERADLRDSLIPLGVTQMSAGSSTRPGGYASSESDTLPQFEIEDGRSPEEVVEAIRRSGYDPVWKDFDHSFHGDAPACASR